MMRVRMLLNLMCTVDAYIIGAPKMQKIIWQYLTFSIASHLDIDLQKLKLLLLTSSLNFLYIDWLLHYCIALRIVIDSCRFLMLLRAIAKVIEELDYVNVKSYNYRKRIKGRSKEIILKNKQKRKRARINKSNISIAILKINKLDSSKMILQFLGHL